MTNGGALSGNGGQVSLIQKNINFRKKFIEFASLFKTDVNVNGVFSTGYINEINLYFGWVKGIPEHI